MIIMNEIEKMQLATAIDGEGSIKIYILKSNQKKFYLSGREIGPIVTPIVGISNSCLEWIEVLRKICDGGCIVKQKGTNKPVYYLRFTHRKALRILKEILPLLIVKKEEAKAFINYYNFIDAHPNLKRRMRHPDRKKRINMWNEFTKTVEGQHALDVFGLKK